MKPECQIVTEPTRCPSRPRGGRDGRWLPRTDLGRFAGMVGRIPVLDVTPRLEGGEYPTKAAVGEPFEVTALVIREGHDAHAAEVVLVDPAGGRRPPLLMRRDPAEADRHRATVVADTEGAWGFEIHGWSDPYE